MPHKWLRLKIVTDLHAFGQTDRNNILKEILEYPELYEIFK